MWNTILINISLLLMSKEYTMEMFNFQNAPLIGIVQLAGNAKIMQRAAKVTSL